MQLFVFDPAAKANGSAANAHGEAASAHGQMPCTQGDTSSASIVLLASSAQIGQGTQNAARAAAQTANPAAGLDVTPALQLQPPGVTPTSQMQAPGAIPTSQMQAPGVTPTSQMQAPGVPQSPVLRAPINPSGPSQSGKSIDSFFQISRTAMPVGAVPQSIETHKKSKSGDSKSFLWHLMDNAGVPMFYGNTGPELDPRLRRNYQDPQLPDMNVKNNKRKAESTQDNVQANSKDSGDSNDAPQIPHKIPEGQLDGTQLVPPNVKSEP